MSGPLVLGPDDLLEPGSGREFTPERNAEAWERVDREREAAVAIEAAPPARDA